jgi:F0F1-type ATP synthase gamma subunit
MEGSCDNVKKVIGKLNIAFKRARNDKIDANMREIFVSTMVAAS